MEGPLSRTVRLRELLVGVEGLALLRHLYDGTDAAAARRIEEVRRLLADDAFDAGEPIAEADAVAGYRAWADTYDDADNLVIALEGPAVAALVEDVEPGRAIDVACGTGRHTAALASAGHRVVGVDLTAAMLRRAAGAVPAADYAQGDMLALPLRDESADLVVCALAIAHVEALTLAVAELARVLRRGGRLVLSALHPFQAQLGWHAPYQDALGRRGFVREHAHTHAAYLAAFRGAGLTVVDCVEPVMDAAHVEAKRRSFRHLPDATREAYIGLPAVLVWAAVHA